MVRNSQYGIDVGGIYGSFINILITCTYTCVKPLTMQKNPEKYYNNGVKSS